MNKSGNSFWNVFWRVLVIIGVLIVILAMPFVIEMILFEESIVPFSMKIRFGREEWFSFIGSYLGFLGAAFLGALALWQNWRYKKASDQTDEEFKKLQNKIMELVSANTNLANENKGIQEKIRDITQRNADVIASSEELQREIKELSETNLVLQDSTRDVIENMKTCMEMTRDISNNIFKMKQAEYYPRFTMYYRYGFSDNGKLLSGMEPLEENAFSVVLLGCDMSMISESGRAVAKALSGRCCFWAFGMINDCEHPITLRMVHISFENGNTYDVVHSVWDKVGAHQRVWIIFATPKERYSEFVDEFCSGVTFSFLCINAIGDTYTLEATAVGMEEDNKRQVFLVEPAILENDLVSWAKKQGKEYILDEWDFDRNDDFVPEQFPHNSHWPIWWKCSNGHEWAREIYERTINGATCPFCEEQNKAIVNRE